MFQVQKIKGEADAKATAIYADAYNKDPALYELLKSLESYAKTVDQDSWVVLSSDSDYLKPMVRYSN